MKQLGLYRGEKDKEKTMIRLNDVKVEMSVNDV
jgi:hypothetical protein